MSYVVKKNSLVWNIAKNFARIVNFQWHVYNSQVERCIPKNLCLLPWAMVLQVFFSVFVLYAVIPFVFGALMVIPGVIVGALTLDLDAGFFVALYPLEYALNNFSIIDYGTNYLLKSHSIPEAILGIILFFIPFLAYVIGTLIGIVLALLLSVMAVFGTISVISELTVELMKEIAGKNTSAKTESKQPSMFLQYAKAKKQKVCPTVTIEH